MLRRRRELKETINRAKDPLVRMQLQMLLNKKSQQRSRGINKVEDALDSVLRQVIGRMPERAPLVFLFVLITVIVLIIFFVLEGLA